MSPPMLMTPSWEGWTETALIMSVTDERGWGRGGLKRTKALAQQHLAQAAGGGPCRCPARGLAPCRPPPPGSPSLLTPG
eukprot:1189646-Prorocentrum_minimum.AAC.2